MSLEETEGFFAGDAAAGFVLCVILDVNKQQSFLKKSYQRVRGKLFCVRNVERILLNRRLRRKRKRRM